MNKIKYLLSLTPQKMLTGGMMLIISFLASGWGLTEYRFATYRTEKEKEIIEMEKAHSQEKIALYNRIIDGQTKRSDQVDSALAKVGKLLESKK